MLEALGRQYLDAYFRQCRRLLNSHGATLPQAITMREQFYAQALMTADFKRCIFAGSFFADSFLRMWEYYLCYCEGGFEERQLGDVHMRLTKPRSRQASLTTIHAPAA